MRLVAAGLLVAMLAVVALVAGQSSKASSKLTLPAIKGPALKDLAPGGCDIFLQIYGIPCYGPYELSKAYDFPTNLDGSGQTIVIVDAYGSANIRTDLQLFDAQFGVPDPAPGQFVIENGPPAVGQGSGDAFGWGLETSLDVEYAHAMAPGAKIVLAVGSSDDDNDLNNAEAAILPKYPGAIVSHSFGDWETDPGAADAAVDAHQIYQAATRLGDTLVASTGDAGATFTQYTGTTSPALASYPASDPLVTAVGGTQGYPYPFGLFQNGGYGGEATWNEGAFDAAGGGAPSVLFAAPPWQRPVSSYKTRTIPDVSYNAAIEGGVGVIYTPAGDDVPSIWLVGGTSAGSPQWASIFALVNQGRASKGKGPLGFANDALYKIGKQNKSAGDFHDITLGDNALDSPVGFAAGPGYDLATGWGTPDVAKLVPDLVDSPAGGNPNAGAPAKVKPGANNGSHKAGTALPG